MAELKENKTEISAEQLAAEKLKAEKIKKIVMWSSVGVGAIAVGVLIYIFAYRNPQIDNGNKQLAAADKGLAQIEQTDSVKVDSLINVYKNIAANNGFAAGNIAGAKAAILLYQKGDYKGALAQLEEVDFDDAVIGSACYSLKGDCLVNLGKDNYGKALEAYDDAIDQADENPQLVPVYMLKKANVYRAQQDFAKEFETYEAIKSDYPFYFEGTGLLKYYQRAKTAAGK